MHEIAYGTPGSSPWIVARSSDFVVSTPFESAVDIRGLWAAVTSAPTVGSVLEHLTKAGLGAAPSFVIVSTLSTTSLTVLVRGSASVSVVSQGETRVVSAVGISTWAEQSIGGADSFSCDFEQTGNVVRLPLVSGVVLASGISGSLATAPMASALHFAPEPADVFEPPVVFELAAVAVPDVGDAPPEEVTLIPAFTITAPPSFSAPAEPVEEQGSQEPGYDYLFGETVFRSVEDAAVRVDEVEESSGPAAPVAPDPIDSTQVVVLTPEERARRRAQRKQAPGVSATVRFFVDLSTGGREYLDAPLVVGRAPTATRVSGGSVPRLVKMMTPNQDISRTHAEIRMEGDTVLVTDLHSSNGTFVTLPGKQPQKLREGEPSVVIEGAVLDLGDGATLTVGRES